jgi:putative component of toxin-antitoxin plasmid stabilization module
LKFIKIPLENTITFNWENGLSRDVRAIVTARLARIRVGNFGDCKAFEGINELRIIMEEKGKLW